MQLHSETDCALRMLLYLASENRQIVAREIAKKIGVNKNYVFKVADKLKKAKFVDSTMGTYGGYSLARPPDFVTVYDIAGVFEDTMQCSRLTNVTDPAVLAADQYYRFMERRADNIMRSHTLSDLLKHNYGYD